MKTLPANVTAKVGIGVGHLALACAISGLAAWPDIALAQSKQGFETEAKRLNTVRKLIASESMPRPAAINDQYRQRGTTAPACNVLLQDLLVGKYKAIEPVQIRATGDPTYFDQRQSPEVNRVEGLRGFSRATTDKLRYCASEEAAEKLKDVGRFFFGFDHFAGEPPYRVYRLSPVVNPYPDSDFAYWSAPNIQGGWTYSWVNLDVCKPVWGTQTYYSTTQDKEWPGGNAQALALYRGKFTYLEAHKGFGFSIQHLEPGSIRADTVQRLGTHCSWATYLEKPIAK